MGIKIIQSAVNTEKTVTKNQFPFTYKQQTPISKQKAKKSKNGNSINLCFVISFGKFVKQKEKSKETKTIQNQLKVLLIAKLQIKQGIIAKA